MCYAVFFFFFFFFFFCYFVRVTKINHDLNQNIFVMQTHNMRNGDYKYDCGTFPYCEIEQV